MSAEEKRGSDRIVPMDLLRAYRDYRELFDEQSLALKAISAR
jgi:hypothetical protein